MSGNAKLDEIEARLAAATPGTWNGGGDSWRAALRTVYSEGSWRRSFACIPGHVASNVLIADAALIAHAPADIALLLRIARIAADALCDFGGAECPDGVLAEFEPHASKCMRYRVHRELEAKS